MQGSLESRLVYLTHSQEDLLPILHFLSLLIAQPESLFTPIHGFQVTYDSQRFQVEIETKEAYFQVQDTAPGPATVRKLCGVLGKVLECAAYAETQQGSRMGYESLLFRKDISDIRLSPLRSDRKEGSIEETLRQLLGKCRAGRTHPTALSDLLDELRIRAKTESPSGLKDWWTSACAAASAASVPQLNEWLQRAEWESAQDLLDWSVDRSLRFAVCMSRSCLCTQEPHTVVWTCSRHCFCSDQCRAAASSSPGCPLCGTPHPKGSTPSESTLALRICPCGQEFPQGSSDAWRLSLLGSTLYESATKCCSEPCLTRFFSELPINVPTQSLEWDPDLCLECQQPLSLYQRNTWSFPCKYHYFCSSDCQAQFTSRYTPDYCIHLPCLFCDRELTCKLKADDERYREMLADMKVLQQTVLRSRAKSTAIEFILIWNEINTLITENKSPRDTRPAYLSLKKLGTGSWTWLLVCCVCQMPVSVNLFPASTSFLVRCEFKVHCVCSSACAQQLSSLCPLCPDSQLYPIATPDIASLAILRAVPATSCLCQQTPAFFDLPECPHSVCIQCLARCITMETNHSYRCFVCFKPYDRKVLMSQVFT